MDQQLIQMSCRHCKRTYPLKSFSRHAEYNANCKHAYTQQDIEDIKSRSKEVAAAKKKLKDAARYQRKKAEIAANYQEKKVQIAEKYDKLERAKKYKEKKPQIAKQYQMKKDEIAEKYQKKKRQIAQKYNKSKRAKKYQERKVEIFLRYYKKKYISPKRYDKELRKKNYKKVMTKLAIERKELGDIKQYQEGRIFSDICDKLFLDCYHKFEIDRYNFALGMAQLNKKQYEDDIIDDIFVKELRWSPIWHSNFCRKIYDCGECNRFHDSGIRLTCTEFGQYLSEEQGHEVSLCCQHMSDSELDDLIAASMLEKFQEEVDYMISKKAKVEVGKELKLALGYDYSSRALPGLTFPRTKLYTDVAERIRNKAFRTFLLKGERKNYATAFSAAKSAAVDKCLKKYQSNEKNMDFLIEELEALGVYIGNDISDMFEKAFMEAIEKNFLMFKDEVASNFYDKNDEKKEWAIEKLKQIKAVEKYSIDKGKKNLIEDAELEIEKIHEQYEEEIEDASLNCVIPFEVIFCFSAVVKIYPDFKGPREDPLFHSLTDNYEVWFEKLKKELGIRK